MAAASTSTNEIEMDLDEEFLRDEDCTNVDLGFLEKCQPWRLKSEYFPSKVGGKPSWLNLLEVPTSSQVQCENCNEPCIFICQIYAPIEDLEDSFHRTIFIFMCATVECSKLNSSCNFKVLRCQLARRNEFYSYDPPVESDSWNSGVQVEQYGKLCKVCNLRSTSHCGKCRNTYYCCRQHQVFDWKAGHKIQCCSEGTADNEQQSKLLIPEWELATEREPLTEEDMASRKEKSNEQRLQEFQELVKSGLAGTMHGNAAAEADFEAMPEGKEDIVFKKFKCRIARSPTQVLRYDREGQPLWVAEEGQPEEVQPCTHCGGPRVFEFQILPQMLYYLRLDGVDWGTLAVFTCQQSCNIGPAYKEEVLIKQDFIK